MPKKTKGKNGFYEFMMEWKDRTEKTRGRKFATMLELQNDPALSQAWQSLTPVEKAAYANISNMNMKKKTTLGEDLDLVQQEEREKQLFLNSMVEAITETVELGIKQDNLHKLGFYFIHVNYHVKRIEQGKKEEYFPAEFAVAKFSLEQGITEVYHEILSTKLPLGYSREAMELSHTTHQIPHNLPNGQKDYNLLYKKLLHFFDPDQVLKRVPPLYSTKENIPVVHSLLDKMMNAARVRVNKFLVYSIEHLFATLYNSLVNVTCSNSVPNVLSENQFLNNPFSHESGIECAFHKMLNGTSQYCSQAIVKQWSFIICDFCCQLLDIEIIDGVHRPKTKADSTVLNALSDSLAFMNINKPAVQSMTGVHLDYSEKVSARTKEEIELMRKQQKPVSVIDHSKVPNENPLPCRPPSPVFLGRPLRAPKTASLASLTAGRTDLQEFNDDNFPKIGGRGIRNLQGNMSVVGKLRNGK